jgi:LysR family nitrogen assimilation transcriptional regulator
MTLEQLKLFLQTADAGSLTKAAIAANSLQSVISRQISALERECGGRLFHRTGRGVALTDLGRSVLPRIRQVVAEIEALTEEIRGVAEIPSGNVRFGILPALSLPIVQKLYRQARDRYPKVRLHLFEGSNGQLEEWIATGRVDLALLYRYGAADPVNDRILGVVHAYLIGAAGDRTTTQLTIPFRRLARLPLIVPSAPSAMRRALDQLAKREGISLNVVMEADSLPIQKAMAATGDAYAIVGRQGVIAEVTSGSLQASRIVAPTIDRTAILAVTPAKPLTLAMQVIGKLIESLARSVLSNSAHPGGGTGAKRSRRRQPKEEILRK